MSARIMKSQVQEAVVRGLARGATESTRNVRWFAESGPGRFDAIRAPDHDVASTANQTTVLHAKHLHTLDAAAVNVVVALHWHIRDPHHAAAVAVARSGVKSLAQASLDGVVSSTPLATLQLEHAMVELKLCNRMTVALAGLGIDVLSCRIRDVAARRDDRGGGAPAPG
jgi:hypothetical protein